MLSPQEVKLHKRERFDWYANQVKFKFVDEELPEPESPTPVFPGLDYTKVSPALATFDDNMFFSEPSSDYIMEAFRLSLHIFFSLPSRCLVIPEIKRTRSQTEIEEVESVSEPSRVFLFSDDMPNNCPRADTLFHRAVMSDDSYEMNFDETYQRMNDFVRSANDRMRYSFCNKAAYISQPFIADPKYEIPESATKGAFESVLSPIMTLFPYLWGNRLDFYACTSIYDYKNQVDQKDKTEYIAIPDFAVKEDGEPFVCIEVKFPSIDTNDPLTQAVSQCICGGTPYGVVTNYMDTLCFKLEVEEEDIEKVKKFTGNKDVKSDQGMFKYVKFRYVRVKNDASVNTLSCVLAAHIFKAREDMVVRRDDYRRLLSKLGAALQFTDEEMVIRDRKSYNWFRKYLQKKRPENSKKVTFTVNGIAETVNLYDMIPFDKSSMRIIQQGHVYNAQVLEINAQVFEKLTANVRHTGVQPGTSRYLLKLFDPVRGKKVHNNYTFNEPLFRRFIKHTFFRELVMYRQLKSLWGKCIPRLYHAGMCHLSDNDGFKIHFGGLFLIIEFIDGTPPDFSRDEIRQSARDALKAMHALGAVHGDISSRNMIQHKDQVFFLDFGLSTGKFYKKNRRGRGLKDLKDKDEVALEKAIFKYLKAHGLSTQWLF